MYHTTLLEILSHWKKYYIIKSMGKGDLVPGSRRVEKKKKKKKKAWERLKYNLVFKLVIENTAQASF